MQSMVATRTLLLWFGAPSTGELQYLGPNSTYSKLVSKSSIITKLVREEV